jgi:hypothetical protein
VELELPLHMGLVLLVLPILAQVVTEEELLVVGHIPEVLEAQVLLLCAIQIHLMQHYQQQAHQLSQ